eukprot:362905-Chlamydomonas_euryale.AAC.2
MIVVHVRAPFPRRLLAAPRGAAAAAAAAAADSGAPATRDTDAPSAASAHAAQLCTHQYSRPRCALAAQASSLGAPAALLWPPNRAPLPVPRPGPALAPPPDIRPWLSGTLVFARMCATPFQQPRPSGLLPACALSFDG